MIDIKVYILIAHRKDTEPFIQAYSNLEGAEDYKEYLLSNNEMYKYDSIKIEQLHINL